FSKGTRTTPKIPATKVTGEGSIGTAGSNETDVCGHGGVATPLESIAPPRAKNYIATVVGRRWL
ncbi:hypothetical protein A2U01_0077786, partial [Trifolium medium]|nr:hypothetical protein [Trifolium medium]